MTLQRQRLAARVFDQAMRFSAFLQAWPGEVLTLPVNGRTVEVPRCANGVGRATTGGHLCRCAANRARR